MDKCRVAVVGLGPAGLTSLKSLLEEGFRVDAFERRERVGGVWAYSNDLNYTSVIPETVSNVSRFLSAFSDFPVPQDWPVYMTGRQVAEYFEAYATHFQLEPHIRFSTTVVKVVRDKEDRGWDVHTTGPNGDEVHFYDKVVFGNGSDTVAKWPSLLGRERFRGAVIHGQQFRDPEQFKGNKVVVVGIGNTACEIALSLVEHASRVHQSYRHGRIILSRFYENGYPSDMVGPWPSLRFGEHLRHHLPLLSRTLADRGHERQMVSDVMRLDPALNRPGLSQRQKRKLAQDRIRRQWHLLPCASATQVHPVVQEHWIPALSQQQIVPVRGFKSFGEGGQVHFQDGSTIEDVDAVIFCTGYSLDFSIFPALEMDGAEKIPVSKMRASSIQQQEPSLPRLFQMIFPPKWASSIAFLSWMSVLDTAWCTCELASMAVAQAWAADCAQEFGLTKSPSNVRPSALLPSEKKMNASVDAYQDWWRKQWRKEPSFHPGYPQSHTFVRFLHETAGTGMFDHMDHPWTLNRWKLWWKDRALYTWLTKGPANSHAFRLFDTNPDGVPGCGRRTWQGARHAVEKEYNLFEAFKRDMEEADSKNRMLNSIPKGR